MKKWLGYLVAGVTAAIGIALINYAKAYSVLVDMVYPYVTRLVVKMMANVTGGIGLCVWQCLLVLIVAGALGILVWMVIKRSGFGSYIRWFGWVLAVVGTIFMCNTVIYGLNKYSSPLADDVALEIRDWEVADLGEAAVFFRDKANELSSQVPRKGNGKVKLDSFKNLAEKAGDGFQALTYDQAMSVFAGTIVPAKKMGVASVFCGNDFGMTVALTGEACVNTRVPDVILPFAICNEMAHRMSIYSDADAAFAAYLAGTANPAPEFQYAAYLMAYNYCYTALENIPLPTAEACAAKADKGVNGTLRADLETVNDFLGQAEAKNNRAEIPAKAKDENAPLHFSEYTSVVDLLANWYIKYYIIPLHAEEEAVFNPLDPSQVDLSGLPNVKKK